MWNVEFNTINDFLWIDAQDLGIRAQFLQLVPIPQIY